MATCSCVFKDEASTQWFGMAHLGVVTLDLTPIDVLAFILFACKHGLSDVRAHAQKFINMPEVKGAFQKAR